MKGYHQEFFKKAAHLERKMRRSTGFLVAYHMREAEQINAPNIAPFLVALPSWFPQLEVS